MIAAKKRSQPEALQAYARDAGYGAADCQKAGFSAAEFTQAGFSKTDVRLVIDDRADVALAVGADGVHLGRDDLALSMPVRGYNPEAGLIRSSLTRDVAFDRYSLSYYMILT